MKDLGTFPTITCPVCNLRQTAITKKAEHKLIGFINPGDYYIICVRNTCKNVFTGEVLTLLLDKYDTQKPFQK